jgi:AAA domain-containing protein
MKPNPTVVQAFLADVHELAGRACEGLDHPGVLQLSKVDPETDKLIVSGRFNIGDVNAMAEAAIADAESGYNSYVEARTIRKETPPRERGDGKTATRAVFALNLDRDGDKGMAGAEFLEPTMRVNTSPGNGHDWLVLDKALSYETASKLGATIRNKIGADNDTGVPTQPYRVAGTPNYPNAIKRERGRTTCETQYVNGGPVYSYEQLLEAAGGKLLGDCEHNAAFDTEATGEIDATVEELIAEPLPKGQRSTRFSHAVKSAVERGMTAADFEALCRKNLQGCAQKYLPPERRDELQTRIAEIWEPHAADVGARDALGVALVKGLLETFASSKKPKTTITQVGEWVRGFGEAADPLIEDSDDGEIIGRAQQGVLYGPMGTGKTALANEMGLAVATGVGMGIQHLETRPLFRSLKGRVLVAIYEDPFDFRRRMIALAKVRGVNLDALDWAIVSADLNITKEKDRAILLQRIQHDSATNGPPALLILDTVAAALGAESSNDDDVVGKLFAVSQSLVREFMCTTIFVAHPGKDETRGIAGSYRFQGNSDFILRTVKTKDGFRLMKDKDRNGAKRPLFDYTLEFVEAERTASGKPRTGAIVGAMTACTQDSYPKHSTLAIDADVDDIPKRKLSDRSKLALDALAEISCDVGKAAPGAMKLVPGTRVVALAEWRAELFARGVLAHDSKNPRSDFKRVRDGLAARGLIAERDGVVWTVAKK